MSRILIDDHILFDEENFTLSSLREDAPEPLRLGAIASRCLSQLLRAKGQILSKRDLMDGSWGEFGLEVTDNSLAQVIRQLRLAFEKLEPDRSYIVNLPRIGYKLAENISIKEEDGEVISAPKSPIITNVSGADSKPVHRKLTWLALCALVWASLFFAVTHWHHPELPLQTLNLPQTIRIDKNTVHLPADFTPTPAQREAWAISIANVVHLAQLSKHGWHLYLIRPHNLNGFICDDVYENNAALCTGVRLHDQAH